MMTKSKLLVLDDETRILSSIEDLFEEDNEVLTTTDPAAALRLLEQEDVSVILTDERMPTMCGHEFLRRAKELSRATRIIMSGYSDLNALTAAVNEGNIFAFVTKPWDPMAFKDTIRAAGQHFALIQAVEHERQLLRVLMESIPDPIYFKDSSSKFIRINRETARVLGAATPEECIGKMDADFLETEYALRTFEEEQEIVRSGKAISGRIEKLAAADGAKRWMSTTKVPIDGKNGLASGLACISRDITSLKDAEESLLKGSSLLQLLQSVTVAANASSEIEQAAWRCLDLICAHTGWPVGHLWLLAPGSDSELISSSIWRMENQKIEYEDLRKIRQDGSAAPSESLPVRVFRLGVPEWTNQVEQERHAGFRSAFALPILEETGVAGVLEFFSFLDTAPDSDLMRLMPLIGSQLGQVSQRQKVNEELKRAKNAAEDANRAKSEFLATISHEIRTPLNAILGMSELLAATTLNEEQRGFVTIFQRGGTRLLSLINDLLDLSKVESGHFELRIVEFELCTVLERAMELVRPRAVAKGLRLAVDIRPGVPMELTGDPDRLQQVLTNVIGNALKFTEEGGVSVRVEVDPQATEPGWIQFSVADTGIGIPAEKMHLIFDRFTQIDSSATRKYDGTGLGLPISKAMVELMGGEIGVSSEVGKGSVFTIRLRCGLPGSAVTPEPTHGITYYNTLPTEPSSNGTAKRMQRGTRILIVDDSDDNVFLVQAFLKGAELELDVARNGWEGVEKVLSHSYDLVLMDIQMPVMDGHTATRTIRLQEQERRSPAVPIVALTAHASSEAIEQCMLAGCTGHVSKPVSQAGLLAAIAQFAKVA